MMLSRLFAVFASLVLASGTEVMAQEASGPILFTNVNVFDGVNERLIENANVVVTDNLITEVSTEPLAVAGGRVIDGGGRTMIPGLIDAHWHTTYAYAPASILVTGDMSELAIKGFLGAEATLMRGFTSVRDMGGNPFAIVRMTDTNEYAGPRVIAAGPPISQTAGHFDFAGRNDHPADLNASLPYWERNSVIMTADGVDEVILRTRENLRMGAGFIKIAAGGGVSSTYDDLDVQEFLFEEMKTAVDVASSWNTYVAAHVFTDAAVQTALRAGVKSIEHGNLITDPETWRMMKAKDAWISLQPLLNDEDALHFDNAYSNEKYARATDGTDNAFRTAIKMGINISFGTDSIFDPAIAAGQGRQLAKLKRWFTPFETLRIATSENARLLALSGPRNHYREGPLGVIKPGAYADLILVNGNPLEDIDLVANPEKNFALIMKDGKIWKNEIN